MRNWVPTGPSPLPCINSFYSFGLTGANDPNFRTKFINVYRQQSLQARHSICNCGSHQWLCCDGCCCLTPLALLLLNADSLVSCASPLLVTLELQRWAAWLLPGWRAGLTQSYLLTSGYAACHACPLGRH